MMDVRIYRVSATYCAVIVCDRTEKAGEDKRESVQRQGAVSEAERGGAG
jgi:hypothetical protein